MSGAGERLTRARGGEAAPIVRPGGNCWRVEQAERFASIQDAADYFRLVRKAMLNARRTVFALGWDTSAHTDLLPGAAATDGPTRLDKLLAFIARRRPDLQCYILTWDYGLVHTFERDPFTRWRLGWRMPSNVQFAFDDRHAAGGCHHQKVVVIDDQLAFCGGIDLTGHRWDTCAHHVDEPARVSLNGDAYDPYHEVQAMASGPIAAALGTLARDRWRAIGVETLPPVAPSREDHWPAGLAPDLTNVPVAISRTVPALDGQPAIRECETLFTDSIALARRSIYIESQYFTDDRLAGALAGRLRDPDGPEVIVVAPKECYGWLEQETMGAFRAGAFRMLIDADAHRRLRIVYPAASRSRDVPTFIHSKVMFVDDRFARIGSANFSKRSMGVDTECDLAVDAGEDAAMRAGIVRMRDRLLAEHLGLRPEDVARELETRGSMAALIDAHERAEHTLVRVAVPAHAPPASPVLRAAADPDEPIIDVSEAIEALVETQPAGVGSPARRRWRLPDMVVGAAAMAGVALLVRHTLRHPSASTWFATGGVGLGLAVGLRTWRLRRQVTTILSRQRGRAEFG